MQIQTWQQGSSNPENPQNFAAIRQWWQGLNGKEITWKQRLLSPSSEASTLNWEKVRFDEEFVLIDPQIRGITLYWRKIDNPQERNTTPDKLILDSIRQQLYIFPQSQKELVIRVESSSFQYQTLEMRDPQYLYSLSGENHILSLRDGTQMLEVKVTLTPENLKQLMRQLLQSKEG